MWLFSGSNTAVNVGVKGFKRAGGVKGLKGAGGGVKSKCIFATLYDDRKHNKLISDSISEAYKHYIIR